MYVADDFDGGAEFDEGGLAEEYLPCCETDGDDLRVLETHRFGDFGAVSDI
jgi:hypothetical protein